MYKDKMYSQDDGNEALNEADKVLDDHVDVRIIDTGLFLHKDARSPITPQDMEKLLEHIGALESAMNRKMRNINRHTNVALKRTSEISIATNTALSEIHERLDRLENIRSEDDDDNESRLEQNDAQDDEENDDDQNNEKNDNNSLNGSDYDDEHTIHMLNTSSVAMAPFKLNAGVNFSAWMQKFEDYIAAIGTAWTAEAKSGRLAFLLEGEARSMYEQLTAAQKADYRLALARLKELINNTQARDTATQKLAMCFQAENETVLQFSERLRTIVEDASSGYNEAHLKLRLRDEFLNRISEEIRFYISIMGGAETFDDAKAKAIQIEASRARRSLQVGTQKIQNVRSLDENLPSTEEKIKSQLSRLSESVQALALNATANSQQPPSNQFPAGNYSNWAPARNQNRDSRRNSQNPRVPRNEQNHREQPYNLRSRRYQNNNNRFDEANRRNGNFPRNQRNNNSSNYQRANDAQNTYERQWNNKPLCSYCKKTGHIAYNCFKRLQDLGNTHNTNALVSNEPAQQHTEPHSQINDLAKAIANLSVQKEKIASLSESVSDERIERKNVAVKPDEVKTATKISRWESRPNSPLMSIGPYLYTLGITMTIALSIASAAAAQSHNAAARQQSSWGPLGQKSETQGHTQPQSGAMTKEGLLSITLIAIGGCSLFMIGMRWRHIMSWCLGTINITNERKRKSARKAANKGFHCRKQTAHSRTKQHKNFTHRNIQSNQRLEWARINGREYMVRINPDTQLTYIPKRIAESLRLRIIRSPPDLAANTGIIGRTTIELVMGGRRIDTLVYVRNENHHAPGIEINKPTIGMDNIRDLPINFRGRTNSMPVKRFSNSGWIRDYALAAIIPLLTVTTVISSPIPNHPMLCQTEKLGTVWEIPTTFSCPNLATKINTVPFRQELTIYKPNIAEYLSKAWICRKLKKGIRKYTNLMGDHFPEHLPLEHKPISVAECRQMIEHKTCSRGDLKQEGEHWQTGDALDWSYRWPGVGYFWSYSYAENCYLYESTVTSHYGEEGLNTPVGEAAHCNYDDGNCILADETVLIWQRNITRSCRFTKMASWKGKRNGNAWLDIDEEFALTFPEKQELVDSCDEKLIKTEQGYAVKIIGQEIAKRKSSNRLVRYTDDGLVMSTKKRRVSLISNMMLRNP